MNYATQANHPCWTEEVERAKMLSFKATLRTRAQGRNVLGGDELDMARLLCSMFPAGNAGRDPADHLDFETLLQAILLLRVPDVLDYSESEIREAFSSEVADLLYSFRLNNSFEKEASRARAEYVHFTSSPRDVQTIKLLEIYVTCLDVIPTRTRAQARRWVSRNMQLTRGLEKGDKFTHLMTYAKLTEVESALDELEGNHERG